MREFLLYVHILHAFNAPRERISTFGVRQERTKLARVAAIRARSSELIGASFAPLRQVGERGCCPTRSMQHVFLSPASQSPATLQLRKCTAYTTHKEAGETEDEFLAEHTEGKEEEKCGDEESSRREG